MGNELSQRFPVVYGTSILKTTLSMLEDIPETLNGAMYKGKSIQSAGGSGTNIAKTMCKLFGEVKFISVIGDDIMGEILLKLLPEPLRCNITKWPGYSTSSCTVIVDQTGDCKCMLRDMEIQDQCETGYYDIEFNHIYKASVVIFDDNLPFLMIERIFLFASRCKVPIFYEPTDLKTAGKAFYNFLPLSTKLIRLVTPNYDELQDIVKSEWGEYFIFDKVDLNNVEETLASVTYTLIHIAHMFDCIAVNLGQTGIVLCINSSFNPYTQSLFVNQKYIFDPTERTELPKQIIFFPTPNVVKGFVSDSGVGDSFAGVFFSGLLKEYTVTQSIGLAFHAAGQAVETFEIWEDCEVWKRKMDDFKKEGYFNEKLMFKSQQIGNTHGQCSIN